MDATITDISRAQAKRREAVVKLGAQLQRMVREARAHPLGLYRLCFLDDRGDSVTIKWFHQEWANLCLNNQFAMIEAPRGSTKTTFMVCLILWTIGTNPDIRIKIVCGNDTKAAKRLGEIRSHINSDPLYKLVFPNIQEDPDRKNDSLNLNVSRNRHSRDATIEARGVLSDGTGDRADLILFDDVCTLKNTILEPATRPKVTEKVQGDWLNTINPRDGRAWCIFTPWHREDANAILKKTSSSRWAYKHYAHGRPNDPYFSIFPELYSSQVLRSIKLEIGAYEYARAYLCKTLSDEMQIVRPEWLIPYNPSDITTSLLNRAIVILSIDPIGGKPSPGQRKNTQDFLGMAVLLVDPQSMKYPTMHRPSIPARIYVPEAYQTKLSTGTAAQHVIELHDRWKPDEVLMEKQGAQTLDEWVVEVSQGRINPIPIPATISKRQRLESITPWFQDPRQRVLCHPQVLNPTPKEHSIFIGGKEPQSAGALRDLRSQLLDFPTTHDDILDATVQGLRYIRQYVLPEEISGDGDPDLRRQQIVEVSIRSLSA